MKTRRESRKCSPLCLRIDYSPKLCSILCSHQFQSTMGPGETPTSMAVSAKEKIQASANHLWFSIRNLDMESKKRTAEKSDVDKSPPGQATLESVMRAMFSSCTTGGALDEHMKSGSGSPERTSSFCNNMPKVSREDPVYQQLFVDSKLKAEEAVSQLREQLELRKEVQKADPSAADKATTNAVPKPFPISTPTQQREISIPKKMLDTGPSISGPIETTSPLHTASMSFDDGISAISAQTLEEMARIYELDETLINRVHSDVTQDPAEPAAENWKSAYPSNASPRRNGSKMGPLHFTRTGRSHGTHGTQRSKGTRSIYTKSTLSTQTTEFANAWRRDEQKYWQDIVKEQTDLDLAEGSPMTKKVRDLSRPDMVSFSQSFLLHEFERTPSHQQSLGHSNYLRQKSKLDGTITTAGSSVHSSYQSTPMQPKALGSFVADDLMDILVLPPGTEMCEI